MQQNRVLKVVKDIFFALLNATLILLAVCLWLAWQLSDTISSAASEFASSLISIEPFREDVRGLTAEVAALREDIVAIGERSGELSSEAMLALQARVDGVEARVSGTFGKLESIASHPETLIDYTVDRAALAVKEGVATLWECGAESSQRTNG